MLYNYASTANNNGSAFAGQGTGTDWYTVTMGISMLMGRFFLIIPALAIGGSLVRKQRVPATAGTFPTDSPLFGGLVVGAIVIIAGLTFFPALALGPIVEHLLAADSLTRRRRLAAMTDHHVVPRTEHPDVPTARRIARRRCGPARRVPGRCSTGRSCGAALLDAFVKLDPRTLARNPVMFVVEVGSVLTTILFVRDLGDSTRSENVFAGLVVVFLWFTVLFANFAEAMAEGRGKAQAATLRKTRSETVARVRRPDGSVEEVASSQLQIGDLCVVTRRRGDPRRRRRRRGHRHRRRVGDHRRVGAR